MIEFEGKVSNHLMSILIDPIEILGNISSKIVELCHLKTRKFKNLWLVQLTTGAKRMVLAKAGNYPIEIVGQPISN